VAAAYDELDRRKLYFFLGEQKAIHVAVHVICSYDFCFGGFFLEFLCEVDTGPEAWLEAGADGDGDEVGVCAF